VTTERRWTSSSGSRSCAARGSRSWWRRSWPPRAGVGPLGRSRDRVRGRPHGGFVGGACAREIVRQQALESLRVQHGRLVSIRPDAPGTTGARDRAESTAEHVVVPMTCASEGAGTCTWEPFVAARTILVVGATPVAEALARLARSMDTPWCAWWTLTSVRRRAGGRGARRHGRHTRRARGSPARANRATPWQQRTGGGRSRSQGHYDEQALESILNVQLPYVASSRRAREG